MSPREISAWLDLAHARVKRQALTDLTLQRAAMHADKPAMEKLVKALERE